MKILALRTENFKRISVVSITPDGQIVQITGANGEGKTSVLDSIWAAIGGKDAAPEQPIRKGKKSARIEVKIGDANGPTYIVERTFTEKDSYLKVTDKDGAKHAKPQQILDGLMGTIGFDPLQFMRMKADEQFRMLRGIVKLDVDIDALDRKRGKLFDDRTGINRDAKSARSRADAIAVPDGLPEQEPDIQGITDRLTSASEHNQKVHDARARLQRQADRVAELVASIEQAKKALEGLQMAETAARTQYEALNREPGGELIDATAVRAELDAANRIADGLRRQREKINADAAATTLERQAEELTASIDAIDQTKQSALASAKMPVDGLGFQEGVVLFNGLPLAQASAAEQLRVSAAIGAALNPTLRVLLARDGSLLDSKSFALLGKFAEENDLQVWVEKVDESGEVGVVMVDGHVKGQEAEVEAFEKAETAAPGAPEGTVTIVDPERLKRATEYRDGILILLQRADLAGADKLNAEAKLKLRHFPELLAGWTTPYLERVKKLSKGK